VIHRRSDAASSFVEDMQVDHRGRDIALGTNGCLTLYLKERLQMEGFQHG
jgi:hypothetical protein